MKKIAVPILLISLVILMPLVLSAQEEDIYDYDERKIHVIGCLGFAASDFQGLAADIGVEFQVSRHLFGQLGFDYYFAPFEEELENTDFSSYGFSLFGVYKIYPRERLNFFVKGGFHYTTIKQKTIIDGFNVSVSQSDFGIAGGIGLEYLLSRKLSVLLGGTYKHSFADDAQQWIKIYCGAAVRIK
jgi:hypothetical protein